MRPSRRLKGLTHGERMKRIDIRDTLRNPDQVARDASAERTDLLLSDSVDVTALAIDAADTIDAENSLEKMLSHQLALAHKASFQIADKALMLSDRVHSCANAEAVRIYSTEAARLMNSSARMMKAFQEGLTTLQKMRTGGNQTMTVQHVHVSEGGQAASSVTCRMGGIKGAKKKNDRQPHAEGPRGAFQASQMRSALSDNREAMQKCSHEKRTLPDARREVAGSTARCEERKLPPRTTNNRGRKRAVKGPHDTPDAGVFKPVF